MDSNSFWFGAVLTLGVACLLLSLFRSQDAVEHESTERSDLQQQCVRLREELRQQKTQLMSDFQDATFEQLQTLLTNFPSARKMATAKPDLPARNWSALFTPLENLLENWDIETIGSPWQQVLYDPQWHQPDADDILLGEAVYIRFVGYRQGDHILCPAKVSRTLPAGITEAQTDA